MIQPHFHTGPILHVPGYHPHTRLFTPFIAAKRNLALATVAVFGLALLVTGVQVLYPRDRMLPFARVNGRYVGFQTQAQLAASLNALSEREMTVQVGDATYQTSLKNLGVNFQAEKSAAALTEYPTSLRLVPFSMFAYGQRGTLDGRVLRSVDQAKVTAFAETIAKAHATAPKEGNLRIVNGNIEVTLPEDGVTYNPSLVTRVMHEANLGMSETVAVQPQVDAPSISADAFETAGATAKVYTSMSLALKVNGQEFAISPDLIKSWLQFVPDANTGEVAIQINKEAMGTSLAPFAAQFYTSPLNTLVTLHDDKEVYRVEGKPGKSLSMDSTAEAVLAALAAGAKTVENSVTKLDPTVVSGKTYSANSKGLQSLVDDWAAGRSGQWGIVVKELGGQGRYASYQADKQFVTASTYKLFLTYPLLARMADGRISGNTRTSTGKTVNACLDSMILNSSNVCGHAFGDMIGWKTVNEEVRARGLTKTDLSFTGPFLTTATDASRMLEQLHYGAILGTNENARIIDLMKRQKIRFGIPAGTPGIQVANKIGYVDSYNNDIGIVYHPKTTYILSVYSSGGSFPQIVGLSRAINNYMNQ